MLPAKESAALLVYSVRSFSELTFGFTLYNIIMPSERCLILNVLVLEVTCGDNLRTYMELGQFALSSATL